MRLSSGEYNSFVIRIWSRGSSVVQGQITHVASRETTRFKSPEQMTNFILALLGPLADQQSTVTAVESQ